MLTRVALPTACAPCRRLPRLGRGRKFGLWSIIKPADGPGDRWSRAIGTGGKSGHRRRRLARAGDESRATRLVTPGDGHAGSAAKWSFTLRRVASSSTRRGAAQLRKVPQRIYRRRSSTVASRRETCETSSKNPGLYSPGKAESFGKGEKVG